MLIGHFTAPGLSPGKDVTSEQFILEGGFLLNADGHELAQLSRGVLLLTEGIYLSFGIASRIRLMLENKELAVQQSLGPFVGINLINGGLWDRQQHPTLLLEFDYLLIAWHVRICPTPILKKVIILPAE